MDNDKHECYKWARHDSGFDPMAAQTTSSPPPSGQKKSGGVAKGVVAGAAAGAIIGDKSKYARRGAAAGDFDGSKTLVCANQMVNDGIEGLADGTGWTMVIDENTGNMSMTAAGNGYVVVAFGACMPR